MLGAALHVLKHYLSMQELCRTLIKYMFLQRKDPWIHMSPAIDKKDKGSRAQLRDALMIYKALCHVIEPTKAIQVTKSVIKAAALEFLRGTLPVIDRDQVESLDASGRVNLLARLLDKFPNSDWQFLETGEKKFVIQVTRCRFPELLQHHDLDFLSSAFCSADIEYFQRFQPDVHVERPWTIAKGHECCEFQFRLGDDLK